MRKRKKTIIKEFNNSKMNNEVYKLRRQVINLIYEIKNNGFNIPRIDVRVGKSVDCRKLGMARLNGNIIWIDIATIKKSQNYLRNVVYHELLHTIYGGEHNEKCPLMSATLKEVLPKNKCLTIFKNYYNKYNNKHQQQ